VTGPGQQLVDGAGHGWIREDRRGVDHHHDLRRTPIGRPSAPAARMALSLLSGLAEVNITVLSVASAPLMYQQAA
jgi:hypothetical protein